MPKLKRAREWAKDYILTVLSVAAAMAAVMMFTGLWPLHVSDHNSFTLQACAWLDGRLDLGRDYEWLELAVYNGKYYVSFPPFPSYVLLPFAAVWGTDTPEALISMCVTLIGAVYAVRLYRLACRDGQGMFWVLFLYLGTGYVFISMSGNVWFIEQVMCFTLCLMAIVHALQGQGFLSLLFWACAVGCRPMVILYLPVLLHILWRQREEGTTLWAFVRPRLYWCIGPLVLGGSYMLLNYLRFGSVLEFGHNYLPEFVRAAEGQFSLYYFPENIAKLFRLPTWNGWQQPVTFYTANCMAFYLIDPLAIPIAAAWVLALFGRAGRRTALLWMLPVLTAVYVFILCCHRTLGGWHFGNRYLLDVMPWLFFGFLRWKPGREMFMRLAVPFAVFGAALNLIGTAAVYNFWIL